MARSIDREEELVAATARRDALRAQLAEAESRVRDAEEAARDAGRTTFLAALDRIKIPAMEKAAARAIAGALARHGGAVIAEHIGTLEARSGG